MPPREEIEVTTLWDVHDRRARYLRTVTADAFSQIEQANKDDSATINVTVRDNLVMEGTAAQGNCCLFCGCDLADGVVRRRYFASRRLADQASLGSSGLWSDRQAAPTGTVLVPG